MTNQENIVTFYAIKGDCIDVETFRGFAKISELAKISNADIYDQKNNPEGIQRDINPTHAKKAYLYCKKQSTTKKMWPEVVLNIRDKKGIVIRSMSKTKGGQFYKIQINLKEINTTDKKPSISRVDGNHRLYYANGDPSGRIKDFKPLDIQVPFLMTDGIQEKDELNIFRDINNEQKNMDTSHLSSIEDRLSEKGIVQFRDNPGQWLASQLSDRKDNNPFTGLVDRGGRKEKGTRYLVKLKSLENYMNKFYNQSDVLKKIFQDEKDIEKIYNIVKNFWISVNQVFREEWMDKNTYRMMAAVGLQGMSQFGGYLIDNLAKKGESLKIENLKENLNIIKSSFTWKKSDKKMKGIGGSTGATYIYDELKKSLPPDIRIEEIEY